METAPRFAASALEHFARAALQALGLSQSPADSVARILVMGDLMGHDTHGLALLPGYLQELAAGSMTTTGEPRLIHDREASLLWDGDRLPGPFLVERGIEHLAPRARRYGSATLVIRRSHHIACLAAYLEQATDTGLVILLASSDPSTASVAPHGGTRALFTPNPLAAGIPTSQGAILIDISASLVTNGMTSRLYRAQQHYDEACLLDAAGIASTDPKVLFEDPRGTILPLGGMHFGHKGFALALLIETLTGGLAGHGRADPEPGWGATVYLQLYDPQAFGGRAELLGQMDWLAAACRDNPPRPGIDAVRVPGDRARALREEQQRLGVRLHASILPALEAWSQRLSIALPPTLS